MAISKRILLLGFTVLACGCGESEPDRPPRFPVHGMVSYNGQPPVGALVRFWPPGASGADWKILKPEAIVEADGSYKVISFDPGDGAPLGEYNVTVRWSGIDAPPGPDLLGDRFSDPNKPVLKVTITEGTNELPPIVLKGPPISIKGPKKAIGD